MLTALRQLRRSLWLSRWYRRQRGLIRSGWYDPAARSDSEAIFIGGCPRSGTTLLREVLHRHPSFVAGVETAMLVPGFDAKRVAERWQIELGKVEDRMRRSANLVEFADSFYGELCAASGANRWIDKAPPNVRVVGRLLSWFPRATFIHVVRDGRDVACSLRRHPREVLRRGRVRRHAADRPIAECADTWVAETSLGLAYRDHPGCVELRYEELVNQLEDTLRRLCARLGEAYDGAMLEPDPAAAGEGPASRLLNNRDAAGPIHPKSIGRWRRELKRAERLEVDHIAGELLRQLGFVENSSWVDE